jgi:hypothetical protein
LIQSNFSETTRQTAVQLQSISSGLSNPPASISDGSNGNTSGDAGCRDLDISDSTSADGAVNHDGSELSVENDLQTVRNAGHSDSSTVRVTTSVTTLRCPHLCPCQCHARSHMRSSPWFKAIIGQMLFSYHSLIRTTPCDYPPCRKTPRKTEFTYYFPHWLASRALIVSSTSGITGPGASISIAMPVVVPASDLIWRAVSRGNVPLIQQLFGQGHSPYVVDSYGISLVLVRTIDSLNIKFRLLRI